MEIVLAYDRQQDVLTLIKEYIDSISQQSDEFKLCLKTQNFDAEFRDMEEKYGLPWGRMYEAIVAGKPAGCVALTRNDDKYCEIKRLYVRPEFRGRHISKVLIEQVIKDACSIGYKHMRLDTFPFMSTAIKIYKIYGFYSIEKYNDNPAKTAIFMQKDL